MHFLRCHYRKQPAPEPVIGRFLSQDYTTIPLVYSTVVFHAVENDLRSVNYGGLQINQRIGYSSE
jgi:hypothetical protein